MQHVGEGLIHAWLDGELDADDRARLEDHVAGCAACAARVAEERAAFDRAASLLSAVAPQAQPPAFDEVAARAGYAGGAQQRSWLMPAAWAASLALAVGLGWMARDLTDQAPVPIPAAPAIGDRASAPALPRALPPATVETDAPPSEPRRRLSGERAAPAPSPPAPAPPSPTSAAPEPVTAVTESVMVNAASSAAAPPATSILLSTIVAPGGWRTVPRTEAAARTGMPLYSIAGLEPVITSISNDERSVRSVFRLETGQVVEMEQQRAGTTSAAAAADSAAGAQAPRRSFTSARPVVMANVAPPARVWSGQRGDVVITLRTTSPAADLDALGGLLRID